MFLLPLALALSPILHTEEVTEDHTGLMPADTPLVLRLESLDAAYASFLRMGELADSVGNAPSKEDFLREMLSLPVDGAHIDPTRPIYIGTAVSMGPPMPTFVLPARDVASIQLAGDDAGATVVVRGDWVGLSMQPGYAPGGTNPVLGAMEPGVAAVHIDLETIFEMFGGLIEMGLEQAEIAMAEEMPPPEEIGGMDVELMMEMYLDGFRTFMDCAESLDLGLHEDGQGISLHGVYTALDGSDLANLFEPRPLPTTLPAAVHPDAQIAYMMSGDWEQVMKHWKPMLDDFIELYPAEMSAGMGIYMDALMDAYALLGNTAVGYGGFGPEGMNMVFYAESNDAPALATKVGEALVSAGTAMSSMGVGVGEARAVEIAGFAAMQAALDMDYEKMTGAFDLGEAAEVDELAAAMKLIYGENPTVTTAQTDGRVLLAMHDVDRDLSGVVGALGADPVPAAPLLSRLRGLPEAMNPLIMYRLEMSELMRAMAPMMESAGGEALPEFPDQPLDIDFWGGISGRRWLMGAVLESTDLKAFIEAIKDQ